jgi:hypothetical protein
MVVSACKCTRISFSKTSFHLSIYAPLHPVNMCMCVCAYTSWSSIIYIYIYIYIYIHMHVSHMWCSRVVNHACIMRKADPKSHFDVVESLHVYVITHKYTLYRNVQCILCAYKSSNDPKPFIDVEQQDLSCVCVYETFHVCVCMHAYMHTLCVTGAGASRSQTNTCTCSILVPLHIIFILHSHQHWHNIFHSSSGKQDMGASNSSVDNNQDVPARYARTHAFFVSARTHAFLSHRAHMHFLSQRAHMHFLSQRAHAFLSHDCISCLTRVHLVYHSIVVHMGYVQM